MLYGWTSDSKVFGSGEGMIEGVLKNPNQYREAIICEHFCDLPEDMRKEFIHSPEAKQMMDNMIISPATMDRITHGKDCSIFNTTICHMAKENEDPLWQEFVDHRIQERRIMDELIDKYGEAAKFVSDNAQTDFIDKCVPEHFR